MDANDTVCVPIDDVHREFLALLEHHPALSRDPRAVDAFLSLLQSLSDHAPMWASVFSDCRATYTFMRGQYAGTRLRNRTYAMRTPAIRLAFDEVLDALERMPQPSIGRQRQIAEAQSTEQDALGFLYLICHAFMCFLDRKDTANNDEIEIPPPDETDDGLPVCRSSSDTIADDSGLIILDRFRKSHRNVE